MTSSYNNIIGTDSANTLIGSTGSDSFAALSGDDLVLGAGSNDIVDLGDGNDSVNFANDTSLGQVYGQGGNDSLQITVAWNTATLSGGAGNDSVSISSGINSVLYGDLGNDTITFGSLTKHFVSSTIYGGNLSNATSSDGEDSIVIAGSMSASLAHGNGGADTISITSSVLGASSVFGGQGGDQISIASGVTSSTVAGNLGNDTITLLSNLIGGTVYGGAVDDTSLDGADSLSINGDLDQSSMVQGNGGDDDIRLAGNILLSTVYGGQGIDLISGVGAARSISGSLIQGNLGNDIINFGSTNSFMNSTIHGSDSTGTLTGSDSIILGAITIQTSTVFGGAGNDTILINSTVLNAAYATSGQLINLQINGFGGADSIAVAGSFVSTTVLAGAGNDTLFINANTASFGLGIYGGVGSDSFTIANGLNLTIFGDDTASDTAGGNDNIILNRVISSTVYGAAGADTLDFGSGTDTTSGTNATNIYADLGTEASLFTGAAGIAFSTLIGGASNDSFNFGFVFSSASFSSTFTGSAISSSIVGGDGENRFLFAGAISSNTITAGSGNDSFTLSGGMTRGSISSGDGNDTFTISVGVNNASILGGTGADSIIITGGVVTAGYIQAGGTGNSIISAAAGITGSTLLGGSGADILNIGVGSSSSRIIGGAGADTFTFGGVGTSTSIVGGDGNDSISFLAGYGDPAVTGGAITNTYFFGFNSGRDTLSFNGDNTNGVNMTIAIDAAYGTVASAVNYNSATSLVTIGGGGANVGSIYVAGVTGTIGSTGFGFTFTTVASSVITALG